MSRRTTTRPAVTEVPSMSTTRTSTRRRVAAAAAGALATGLLAGRFSQRRLLAVIERRHEAAKLLAAGPDGLDAPDELLLLVVGETCEDLVVHRVARESTGLRDMHEQVAREVPVADGDLRLQTLAGSGQLVDRIRLGALAGFPVVQEGDLLRHVFVMQTRDDDMSVHDARDRGHDPVDHEARGQVLDEGTSLRLRQRSEELGLATLAIRLGLRTGKPVLLLALTLRTRGLLATISLG